MARSAVLTRRRVDPFEVIQIADLDAPKFDVPERPSDETKRAAEYIGKLLQNHLVLLQPAFSCLSTEGIEARFEEHPEFMKGRRMSRQKVFAGTLTVETDKDPLTDTHVAVKPYDRRRVMFPASPSMTVAHDWAANLYLDSISTGSAYQPYGLWRNHDTFLVPSLITRFNERSRSLDNTFKDSPDNERVHGQRIRRALELGNFGLGLAHGAQIIHGDAFPQNLATTGNRILFNDTTTLRPFFDSNRSRGKNETKIAEDIKDFFTGVFHVEASSPMSRSIASTALRDPEVRGFLYDRYLDGARLGAERAGLPTGGLVVGADAHSTTINHIVERSV